MTWFSPILWRLRRSAVLVRLSRSSLLRRLAATPPGRRVREILRRGLRASQQGRSPGNSAAFLRAHAISRYSFFQGVLRITGWLETSEARVQSIQLRLPSGATFPVGFSRSGVASIEASLTGRIAFDDVLQVRHDNVELASASLVVTLDGAAVIRIRDLGKATGDPAHALSMRFHDMLRERAPGRLLEVGSRARSGFVRRDLTPDGWEYSGFDLLPGRNVDVTGDAHHLSRHYPHVHFDAVMAYSVLEHLLMPWKFVIELNRILKPGATGLFTTHQCWPLHDQPHDFWRFSDRAWAALLHAATGFEIIDARMGEPAFIVANRCHEQTAFPEIPASALASFVLFRKIGETTLEWPVDPETIVQTTYPAGDLLR